MPSAFFKPITKTAAPGFSRLISPGAVARIGTSGPTLYSDSPPVKVTFSIAPSAALVTVPTVAFVMTLSGIRSQANCLPPSGVGKDASFDRMDLPVLVLDTSGGDKITWLDIGERLLDQGNDLDIRSESDG